MKIAPALGFVFSFTSCDARHFEPQRVCLSTASFFHQAASTHVSLRSIIAAKTRKGPSGHSAAKDRVDGANASLSLPNASKGALLARALKTRLKRSQRQPIVRQAHLPVVCVSASSESCQGLSLRRWLSLLNVCADSGALVRDRRGIRL